jgi:hypothetical protein
MTNQKLKNPDSNNHIQKMNHEGLQGHEGKTHERVFRRHLNGTRILAIALVQSCRAGYFKGLTAFQASNDVAFPSCPLCPSWLSFKNL